MGPATKGLCGVLVVVSALAPFFERKFGFGTQQLVFTVDAVLQGEIWRMLTYAFVETSPFGLMISAVVLFLFGRSCEADWGTRAYLRFFLLAVLGGAAVAIPLHLLLNLMMPFDDLGRAAGPGAAIDAMMVALAFRAPNASMLFGFVLPIPVKTFILIILAMDVVTGLMTQQTTLSVTLGGITMGYLLTTGNWRPSFWLRRWRRGRRRSNGGGDLYVVPPRGRRDLN